MDGLLCRITAYIHPQRQTPFAAISIFGIIAMLIATFFDLGSVLTFASTTTLLEYTMVCAGTLTMRYCPPSLSNEDNLADDDEERKLSDIQLTAFWTDKRIFLLIWSYFLLCLFTAYIGLNYNYIVIDMGLDILYIVLMIILCGIVLILFCIVMYLDYSLPWKDWIRGGRERAESITFVPLSPFIPMLLIMINSALIASGGMILLLQVLGLCFAGLVVYLTYGYQHSKLNHKYRKALLELK